MEAYDSNFEYNSKWSEIPSKIIITKYDNGVFDTKNDVLRKPMITSDGNAHTKRIGNNNS